MIWVGVLSFLSVAGVAGLLVAGLLVGGWAAGLVTLDRPCAAGWVISDKTILPSAAEQTIASLDATKNIDVEISGASPRMFRRRVVLTMICADGRYVIETRENP